MYTTQMKEIHVALVPLPWDNPGLFWFLPKKRCKYHRVGFNVV